MDIYSYINILAFKTDCCTFTFGLHKSQVLVNKLFVKKNPIYKNFGAYVCLDYKHTAFMETAGKRPFCRRVVSVTKGRGVVTFCQSVHSCLVNIIATYYPSWKQRSSTRMCRRSSNKVCREGATGCTDRRATKYVSERSVSAKENIGSRKGRGPAVRWGGFSVPIQPDVLPWWAGEQVNGWASEQVGKWGGAAR